MRIEEAFGEHRGENLWQKTPFRREVFGKWREPLDLEKHYREIFRRIARDELEEILTSIIEQKINDMLRMRFAEFSKDKFLCNIISKEKDPCAMEKLFELFDTLPKKFRSEEEFLRLVDRER